MDLRIFTEPQQGANYDQQLRMARAAEAPGSVPGSAATTTGP